MPSRVVVYTAPGCHLCGPAVDVVRAVCGVDFEHVDITTDRELERRYRERIPVVSIDGVAPASDKAKLTFEDDSIGANVGCNGMGGPWRVSEGRLIAGPLIQTQMYCEGPVWGQEKAIGALLAGAPELDVANNRLVLKSSGHTAELTRAD